MQKLRTEKGITLIALIITIIVMLILVGVTVSVSLNGGLFTTAKQATNKTQLELDKEQLLELALGSINNRGKVDYDELTEAVAGNFTVKGEGEDATYTSKSGNKFVVNEWGSVTEAPVPVYELSGKWKFADILEPETSQNVGPYLNQEISFKAKCNLWIYDETTGEELYFDEMSFSSIKLIVEFTEGPNENLLHMYYDEYWVYAGIQFINYEVDDYDIIDFGSTPQPVSQEFYDWFTANANPVKE